MFRSIKRVVTSATVAALLIIPATAAPAAAADCPGDIYYAGQQYVQRHADEPQIAGDYFEYTSGDLYFRNLDWPAGSCGGSNSFNAILPANLQKADQTKIWQLGVWKGGNGVTEFVWAHGTPVGQPWPDPYIQVHDGHHYRFEIFRGSLEGHPGKMGFRITDFSHSPDVVSTIWWDQSWSQSMKNVWWGGERGRTIGPIGRDIDTPGNVKIYRLCYRTNAHSGCQIRTGFTNEVHNQYQFNVTPYGGYNYAAVKTVTYANDTLSFEVHYP